MCLPVTGCERGDQAAEVTPRAQCATSTAALNPPAETSWQEGPL